MYDTNGNNGQLLTYVGFEPKEKQHFIVSLNGENYRLKIDPFWISSMFEPQKLSFQNYVLGIYTKLHKFFIRGFFKVF